MIRIAICDDEELISTQMEEVILNICKRESILVEVNVFTCGNSLEKDILKGTKYDLLYLDIQMNNGDGITTAKNIRKMDENVLIIFVSGHVKYIMELFILDVFTFVKKPIDYVAFTKTCLEAIRKVGSKKYYFSFRYKGEEYKIACTEILYFESNGRKIKIYLRNGEIDEFNGKLSEVVLKLSQGKTAFLRIHQSYLVNYNLIKSRTKTEITLVNGTKLPISKEKQNEFGRQYSLLLGGEIDV